MLQSNWRLRATCNVNKHSHVNLNCLSALLLLRCIFVHAYFPPHVTTNYHCQSIYFNAFTLSRKTFLRLLPRAVYTIINAYLQLRLQLVPQSHVSMRCRPAFAVLFQSPFVPRLRIRAFSHAHAISSRLPKASLRGSSGAGDSSDENEGDVVGTLDFFESFCWSAQASLCANTAAADGLGTFEGVPNTYTGITSSSSSYSSSSLNKNPSSVSPSAPNGRASSSHRIASRKMLGGRAFESAIISVWRVPTTFRKRKYRMLAELDPMTSRVLHRTDAAGLSLKLRPRDSGAPLLRADLKYFELGGALTTWWFSGAMDLMAGRTGSPNEFERDVQQFLQNVQFVVQRHRMETAQNFLEVCYGKKGFQRRGQLWREYGEDLGEDGRERGMALQFVQDVIDGLLPSYLPLVKEDYQHDVVMDMDTELSRRGTQREFRESFGLPGGASCESTVVKHSPLGWWRFCVTPPESSPAGKRYRSMTNDEAFGRTPPAYM